MSNTFDDIIMQVLMRARPDTPQQSKSMYDKLKEYEYEMDVLSGSGPYAEGPFTEHKPPSKELPPRKRRGAYI